MKLSKEEQRLLLQKIKAAAKKDKYKVCAQSIFKRVGENFVSMPFVFVDRTKVVYYIGIKKYIYDDIFWEIINMSEK
ncbi:MAG: hypothetical protein NC092_10115 [Butyrivibrio sp.]|nr:hypothetical protein [Butyrivibrio sp.]